MPIPAALPKLYPSPTPERPLLGLTCLAVEDSRFACEALRLLCQHSGARLRRADCLAAAHRHLRVYRPDVLI
ncbi:response regulator, partial [Thioclava sp. BHET1]